MDNELKKRRNVSKLLIKSIYKYITHKTKVEIFTNKYGKKNKKPAPLEIPQLIKTRVGVIDLDPKVMVPFEQLPRRKKRSDIIKEIKNNYSSQDIERLLINLDSKLDFSIPDNKIHRALKLEYFDDESFNIYDNSYWFVKLKNKQKELNLSDDIEYGLPAKYLKIDPITKTGKFVDVLVTKYDKDKNLFYGKEDNKTNNEFKSKKMFICFNSENPLNFGNRLLSAYNLREKANEIIKYNFMIKNIPIHDKSNLNIPEAKLNKIKENSLKLINEVTVIVNKLKYNNNMNNSNIIENEKNTFIEEDINYNNNNNNNNNKNNTENIIDDIFSRLDSAINNDYILTLNKMKFDNLYFNKKSKELCSYNLNLEDKETLPIPYYAKEKIKYEDSNYNKLFATFLVNSLYIKPVFIEGMTQINLNLRRIIRNFSLYVLNNNNVKKVEDFKKEQRNHFSLIKSKLETEGINKIKSILKKIENTGNFNANNYINNSKNNSNSFFKANKNINSNFSKTSIKNPLSDYVPYKFELDFLLKAPIVKRKNLEEDKHKELETFLLRSKLNLVKTSNYINLINIKFKDMLLELSCKSIVDYIRFFKLHVPYKTEINSTNKVDNFYHNREESLDKLTNILDLKLDLDKDNAFKQITNDPDNDLNTTFDIYTNELEDVNEKQALFKIHLYYKEGNFEFSYNITDLIREIKRIFDEGLEKLRVPIISFDEEDEQINNKIMENSQNLIMKEEYAKKQKLNYTRYYSTLTRNKEYSKYLDYLKKLKEIEELKKNKELNNNDSLNEDNENLNKELEIEDLKTDFDESKVNTLSKEVIWLEDMYARLEDILLLGKQPLFEFSRKFNQYKAYYEITPEEHLAKFGDSIDEDTLNKIKEDLQKFINLKHKIDYEIDEQIQVSYFYVNCDEIKKDLNNKFSKIIELETILLKEMSNKIKVNVITKTEEMKKEIDKPVKQIEELVVIEKEIANSPAILENIKEEIELCFRILTVLDDYQENKNINLYPEQKKRYEMYSVTTEVENTCNAVSIALEKQRVKLMEELGEKQETLAKEFNIIEKNTKYLKSLNNISQLLEATQLAKKLEKDFTNAKSNSKLYNNREALFELPITNYDVITESYKDFEPFYKIWTSIDDFQHKVKAYLEMDFKSLKGIELEDLNNEISKNIITSIKKLDDKYKGLIKTAEVYKDKSSNFKLKASMAVALTKEGFKEKHWNQLKEAVEIDCLNQEDLTLEKILGQVVLDKSILKKTEEIADQATREHGIELKVNTLEENWKDVKFSLFPFKNTFTIGGWGDIYDRLDEDVLEVQQMEITPFKGDYEVIIQNWSVLLLNITNILELWKKFQVKFLQLQPIFESPDISKSIPYEHKNFNNCIIFWRMLIQKIQDKNFNVKEVCEEEFSIPNPAQDNKKSSSNNVNNTNNKPELININLLNYLEIKFKIIEDIERGLNAYVDKKKSVFPRFFFISQEDLIEILSTSKDLNKIKDSLKKIFENIHFINLKEEKVIYSMLSAMKEEVFLSIQISIVNEPVENWMKKLESSMFDTVNKRLGEAYEDYLDPDMSRKDWIFKQTGQSCMHAQQIYWTMHVENAIAENKVEEYIEDIQERINILVQLMRGSLDKIKSIKISNLITLEVHNKVVTNDLAVEKVDDPTAFEWIKQLRYYWKNNHCYVKSIQTDFPYGDEYLGNTEILVITPLTDKCYLTLMGALKLNLGGAPSGPAGTGKTESTKDLAKAIAKQCIVYNCSEETDFAIVGKFFKGLACCGSWICFDEFNRINIEVLSVIAQMLIYLFKSKEKGDTDIIFEKTSITIKDTFCVFITMNPGYEGRTELPDNLNALFRPIAMMVPDYRLIAEVYLYSCGYLNAKDLATKIFYTFKLSSEQLSNQFHYDFGMRAVKSVLYASRKFKRQFPKEDEDKLLLRALVDVNLPKFLKEDIPLFKYIIKDLFPRTERPESNLLKLIDKLKQNCSLLNIQPTDSFIEKVMQLYDTIQVRHGLMLVGPTGGGKSSNYKLLQKSLTDLSLIPVTQEEQEDENRTVYFKTELHILNPKSVKKDQLYCEKDSNTMEWINGILPLIVNDINANPDGKKHWILFDGPVDTLWIEDLNSVLDDSKKLCLASSAIIVLSESITMMFEVEDLLSASPATVSRCGMVYMEPNALGLEPIIDSYIQSLPKIFNSSDFNICLLLKELFNNIAIDAIKFIRKNVKEPCPSTDSNLISSLIKIIDCYFEKYRDAKSIDKNELEIFYTSTISIFYYALIWSIGITTNEEGRKMFSEYIKPSMKEMSFNHYSKIFEGGREDEYENILIPQDNLVYDYFFDLNEGKWMNFSNILKNESIDSKLVYTDIIVPTVDSIRYNMVIKLLITNNKHVITTGPTGTGKTINIMDILSKNLSDKYSSLVINFSAQTSANQTQNAIEDKLKQSTRKEYAPEGKKTLVIFVDDLNMPKKEKYGAQPPIEIIRQWFDYKGWYRLKQADKPFIFVSSLIFTGAMGHPGGGKAFLSNRFMRHFNLINYTELVDNSIFSIFRKKVNHFLAKFDEEVKSLISTVVESTLMIYKDISNSLLPIPKTPHYMFNLRDMSKVLQGFCFASPKFTTNKLDTIRLWIHETYRAFTDRLVCSEDINMVCKKIDNVLTSKFNVSDLDEVYNTGRKIIFCDFIGSGTERAYKQVKDFKLFVKSIETKLEEFNELTKAKPMKLVMFLDACDHIARICRIIRQTQGHALLLGVGGSGRQSLARLSSFINEYDCMQIEVSKGYTMNDFRKNLKDVLLKAGVQHKTVSFLLVDTQIFNELMLEDINNCLNTGDVPNLYSKEDWEEIRNKYRVEVIGRNMSPTDTNIFNLYLSSVRSRLHMILAMSPMGEAFQNRLRNLPSLVNCCTIDWFSEWPEEALTGVAADKLNEYNIELGDKFDQTVECIKYIHKSVEEESKLYLQELKRYNYLTPTSFLEFLLLYNNVLKAKELENINNINRYEVGLTVLEFAGAKIAEIEEEIRIETPILEETTKDVEQTIKVLTVEKADAEKISYEANVEKAAAEALNIEITEINHKVNTKLTEAEIEVNKSLAKIDLIDDNDLRVVGGVSNLSAKMAILIELILIFITGNDYKRKANCTMQPGDTKPTLNLKTAMFNDLCVGDVKQFKAFFTKYRNEKSREDLKTVDKHKVDAAYKFIVQNNIDEDFANQAAKSIAPAFSFIEAMKQFVDRSILEVDPLKEEAAKMAVKKEEADFKLDKAQKALDEAEKKVFELQRIFNEKSNMQIQLQDKIKECKTKVKRAKMLVELLSSEKIRWAEQVTILKADSLNLKGDCLIAAGLVAYSGSFISKYRDKLQEKWKSKLKKEGLIISDDVSLIKVMENKLTTREWNISKLPNDKLSVENGIIIFNTRRWPLMIDPQSQATDFLKSYGPKKKDNFQIVKATDPKMMDIIIQAVKFGNWILLENVGLSLETSLEPILLQQKIESRNGVSIKIGEKEIPYNENFKLFMVTSINNPHYSPETFAKITIINFAITQEGLADQMLSELILIEMPDIEQNKIRILSENFKNQETLTNFENKILDNLSSKKDNIEETLKSSELIDILTEAKDKAKDIKEKMIESEKMSVEIESKRKLYVPSAFRASILFFALIDLFTINPMYQYSLFHFKTLFRNTVNDLHPCEDINQRIKDINFKFSKDFFDFICRSLYEKDKALFSFIMIVKILQSENPDEIKFDELRLLLAGPSSDVDVDVPDNPTTFISSTDWRSFYTQIYSISIICPNLKDLPTLFMNNYKEFTSYFQCPKSEYMTLPLNIENKCTRFQKLLLVKTFRLDKLNDTIDEFIEKSIGKEFTELAGFDLNKSYEFSSYQIPLLFILSTGSDPTNDLKIFAESKNKKVEYLSLGKGMEKVVPQRIEEVKLKGSWIVLQNCHLGISFMPGLEKVIEELSTCQEKEFRLWMTSMTDSNFSINVLKSSVKITMEPPKGLKSNLLRQYNNIKDEDLENCEKNKEFKSLYFSLCFFHAIVQDRRKFGPIGWNKKYDFTNEDLMVSRKQLKNFLEEYETIPYKVLNYLIAEINYGGRVTDYNDQRLNRTILKSYLNPEIFKFDEFKFSESGKYYCPKPGDRNDYINYIKCLDNITSPEVFGLHDNAEITTAQTEATNFLDTILSIQPRTSSGSGKKPEDQIMEIATMLENNLPCLFDYDEVYSKYQTDYNESMNTVLIQEVIRYNFLINLIKDNMKQLKLALIGRIVMSDDMDKVFNSLYNNQVPAVWIKLGFLSLKPLSSWISDLNERVEFFKKWVDEGTPKVFELSRFSFPQAFLTGTLQNYARKHKKEIDLLVFKFKVVDTLNPKNINEKPEDGCYVSGLYIEGAKWNYSTHALDHPKNKELYSEMPMILFYPEVFENNNSINNSNNKTNYVCPLYKVLSRQGELSTTGHSTNFVLNVDLPSLDNQEKWIKAGAAMFLSLKQ